MEEEQLQMIDKAFNDPKEHSVTTNSFPREPARKGDSLAHPSGAGVSRYFRPQPTGPVSLTVKKGSQVISQKRKSIISKLGQSRNLEELDQHDHEGNPGGARDLQQARGGSSLLPFLGGGMR